ncbi:heavy metal translocating P-type ATPase [Rhabdochlamydiaceae symbiont of Dictyostelium giganteum]|uniref:heavy metal translocating P-type ATPase n=1 Tax=Rhabdochlamydiaceae symbiont of Dictyostelium giganteum TaxID=3342349 RepID=UPI00384C1FFA
MSRYENFDEFFASNEKESISPFLTPHARKWAVNLSLKASLLAAGCLLLAYLCYFIHLTMAYLALSVVFFIVGTPALIHALQELSRKTVNIDVLMTLAALLSVVIGSPFEGALLLVLFELSSALEELVETKTKSSVHHLHKLSPRCAFVIGEKGHLIEKSIRDITPGTHILVKAGEIIPLDGVILNGRSYVNMVHLTGESAPIAKDVSDEVAAGTHNLDGSLTIQVTRSSGDSTLSRIIQLMTEAADSKPKAQQFFDTFSELYASSIMILSLLFALTLPYLLRIPFLGSEGSLYRALAFLIAASPCALILATPTAYLSALSSCAKKGVLPKGGIILDTLTTCNMIAFDKTGTLTTGDLICTGCTHLYGPLMNSNKALQVGASLERNAVHPIAKAISRLAKEKELSLESIEDFKAIPGLGLQGTYQGSPVLIGHRDFIQQKLGKTFTLPESIQVSAYLWMEESVILFTFQDQMREHAKDMISFMKSSSMKTLMLTGDHAVNANPVGEMAGLDVIFSDLRPEDKLQKITELSQSHQLIMVGDGINDAPSIARATVGISMGKAGSMAAIEASDVILMHDDLSLLPWLIQKAKSTRRILMQNITLALSVILLATTPSLLGFIPLWLAVILHEGGTVLVGLNSLRLLKK